METCKTIREKASELISLMRKKKQNEALAKGAATLRCIDELQELTTKETGSPSDSVSSAREGICLTAVHLAAEKAGDDMEETRKVLSDYGFPPLLD